MREIRVNIWLESKLGSEVFSSLPSVLSVHELLRLDKDKFPLLSMIDEVSNTVFDSSEMHQLILELRDLPTAESNSTIEKILELCEQCKRDNQTVLVFSCFK